MSAILGPDFFRGSFAQLSQVYSIGQPCSQNLKCLTAARIGHNCTNEYIGAPDSIVVHY